MAFKRSTGNPLIDITKQIAGVFWNKIFTFGVYIEQQKVINAAIWKISLPQQKGYEVGRIICLRDFFWIYVNVLVCETAAQLKL